MHGCWPTLLLPSLPAPQRVAALLKSGVRDAAAVKEETVADVADALEGSSALAISDDRKRVRRAEALKAVDEVRMCLRICLLP